MGYTTEFRGAFNITPAPSAEITEYINTFAERRHMKRNVDKIKEIYPDWAKLGFNGELGKDGEYFVGGTGYFGQDRDNSIIDYNCPPTNCPELWCQWIIENSQLVWDGGEKFYSYVEWLKYLIKNFFEPNGYTLSGVVRFQGEDSTDHGKIVAVDNVVTLEYADPFD